MDADSVWLNKSLDNLLQSTRKTGFFAVAHGQHDRGVRQGDLLLNGVFGASKCHPFKCRAPVAVWHECNTLFRIVRALTKM